MPMKEILHRMQPIQVYIVLFLSFSYFIVQMYVSQKSHSITLLVHTYHMLCNVIALAGCVIAIKNETKPSNRPSLNSSGSFEELTLDQDQKAIVMKHMSDKKKQQNQNARALQNTFGWARIEVLTMVIVCTFLASFCFSIVVRVIQTFFHIEHNDHIEHPHEFHDYTYEVCIVLASLGLILNGISYLLIGGYTYHQGSFLHLTDDGNVYVVPRGNSWRFGQNGTESRLKRKGNMTHELARDACSAVMVIFVSILIMIRDDNSSLLTRMIDPIFALLSITILMGLSIPYMKEAGMILLQTVPFSIDIYNFEKEILQKFPQISSIHELHMWELTHSKIVATAHIIFDSPETFKESINDVINFFHEQDVSIATIQPEFKSLDCHSPSDIKSALVKKNSDEDVCLVSCRPEVCDEKLCCQRKSDPSIGSLGDNDCNTKCSSLHVLEQVVSIRDVSAEELSCINSLNSAGELSSNEDERKETSLTSLPIPAKNTIHKTISEDVKILQPNDIEIVSFKRVVSESVIKSDDHDEVGKKASEILVENRLYCQTNSTNAETEDIHAKFDDS